ncbi:MAG: arginase family protein [Planctomycetota bacterium]|jgi:agmatinase
MVDRIARAVADVMTGSPAPEVLAILGGEHSITAGALRGLATSFAEATEPARSLGEGGAEARGGDGLVAVQIDAHADLRDEYDGTPHSHACAARRILETCPLFQIGIRNISKEGEEFRRGSDRVRTVFAEEATAPGGEFLDELASFVRGKTVYFTIDLDGLDPSIMPSTGTPEPGGLSWARAVEIARTVAHEAASVPVFDVVELAPVAGLVAPDFLAAKLAYKVMCLACAP